MAQAVQAPPPTPVEPVTEVLHGIEITDPYRWLEDQNSPRTRKWLEEQTAYTRAYLDAIPGREQIRKRIIELLPLKETISEPWSVRDRYFYVKQYETSEQPVIVMSRAFGKEETILVDPATRIAGPAAVVGIAAISHDGRFLAYSIREGGTDHSALEILDINRRAILPDSLPDGFCTGLAFARDGSGFFYSHRGVQDSRTVHRAVRLHRFGTENGQDQEVFVARDGPTLSPGIIHSAETGLLGYVLSSMGKNRRTSLYLQDLRHGDMSALLLHTTPDCFVPFFVRGQLLAYTDLAAPNFRIVLIDPAAPEPARWRDIVPATDRRIQQFAIAGDLIFVSRIDRFSTSVERFRLDGTRQGDLCPAFHGTIDLLNQTTASEELFYSCSSVSCPPTVGCYDPRGELTSSREQFNGPIDSSTIAVEEVVYPSKDGTSIPLFLAARRDLLHSGALPTFLTGYGGFGSCVTPRFTVLGTILIEQGFLFAVPALRGGSELGEDWHLAGKRKQRQTSFDDFIAAAEWLVATGHSARDRIAIGGGSNAGLLVGAVITQRPDLFRAAVCLGPLLDMARYHLFDFAADWADEYGSADDEQDFQFLISYSPYHRVKPGLKYPAVLFISGDSDTRCNPMHARKMAARLQAASGSGRSILIDYKPTWGHSPVQSRSAKIEALTDRLAFICEEIGVHV
jgi:prolyl oligopeptidase